MCCVCVVSANGNNFFSLEFFLVFFLSFAGFMICLIWSIKMYVPFLWVYDILHRLSVTFPMVFVDFDWLTHCWYLHQMSLYQLFQLLSHHFHRFHHRHRFHYPILQRLSEIVLQKFIWLRWLLFLYAQNQFVATVAYFNEQNDISLEKLIFFYNEKWIFTWKRIRSSPPSSSVCGGDGGIIDW